MVYRTPGESTNVTCPECAHSLSPNHPDGWARCETGCGVWLTTAFAASVIPLAHTNYVADSWWKNSRATPPCSVCAQPMRTLHFCGVGWRICADHGHWISKTAIAQLLEEWIDLSESSLRAYFMAAHSPVTSELTLAQVWVRLQQVEQLLRQEIAARQALEARMKDFQPL